MKRIPLTQGKFTLVDNEDFDRLNQYRWQYNKKDDCGQRNVGVPGSRRTKTLCMAPEVLQTTKMVDHKDGNGLNNQKFNLRECTTTQNGYNRKKQKGASSIYKGVSFDSYSKKWRAELWTRNIFNKRIRITIGFFLNEEEAAKAYDDKARYEFGEFAALNFPREGETTCS